MGRELGRRTADRCGSYQITRSVSGGASSFEPGVAELPPALQLVSWPRLFGLLAVSERAAYTKDMSEHKVTLRWERGGTEFVYQKYPRDHTWSFDGGHTMTASAAPAYLGNPANVDPEEAFVASLSSCHMLTFLAIACKQKFVLDDYTDEAVGHMEKNAEGRLAITRVELHPKITWSGEKKPSAEELDKMHHGAHDQCFIANSVKTEVKVVQ